MISSPSWWWGSQTRDSPLSRRCPGRSEGPPRPTSGRLTPPGWRGTTRDTSDLHWADESPRHFLEFSFHLRRSRCTLNSKVFELVLNCKSGVVWVLSVNIQLFATAQYWLNLSFKDVSFTCKSKYVGYCEDSEGVTFKTGKVDQRRFLFAVNCQVIIQW